MKVPGLFHNAKTFKDVPAGTVIFEEGASGTAVAVADTKLAVIDRSKFLFLVQETPMFALQVMSSMAERIRGAETS